MARGDGVSPEVVPDVDVERYMGRWYAVAHIPTTFERRCVSGITADYTLLESGRIEVVNSCCKEDGTVQRVRGRAWVPDTEEPAKLLVSFVRFLGWWLFPGDYWILALGEDYEFAVVGHPQRTYGWILSRTPTLAPEALDRIIEILEAQGYAYDAFVPIPPSGCGEP
ncbi:MAG: lipocalin family protein [Candidatus Bipolaricaulota bacterium]|nr:MAG: lipocalin family protein [Candidatus Bipolaricaulota bacterium]